MRSASELSPKSAEHIIRTGRLAVLPARTFCTFLSSARHTARIAPWTSAPDPATMAGWRTGAPANLRHRAILSQTPDEMNFGTGAAVPDQLAHRRAQARQARMEANRARRCATCA